MATQHKKGLGVSTRQGVGGGSGPNESLEEGTIAMGINDVGAPPVTRFNPSNAHA
jgi:hypothetical protein